MNKYVIKFIAFFLVPSLVADPVLATALPGRLVSPASAAAFENQALIMQFRYMHQVIERTHQLFMRTQMTAKNSLISPKAFVVQLQRRSDTVQTTIEEIEMLHHDFKQGLIGLPAYLGFMARQAIVAADFSVRNLAGGYYSAYSEQTSGIIGMADEADFKDGFPLPQGSRSFQAELTTGLQRLNQTDRPFPNVLQGLDLDQNADDLIEQLGPSTLHFTPGQLRELHSAISIYFAEERLVHRVRADYLSRGRLAFLAQTGGGLIAPRPLRELMIRYANQLEGGGFVAVGSGTDMNIEIDRLIDAAQFVSTSVELGEYLGGRPGFNVIPRPGIMVVFNEHAGEIENLIAVNAPDTVNIDFMGRKSSGDLRRQLMSPSGLNRLREEMVIRQGLTPQGLEYSFMLGAEHYTPLEDREVLIPEGIGPDFVETIVASEPAYTRLRELAAGTPLESKIKTPEQYAARDAQGHYLNPRLQRGAEARQSIESILSSATKDSETRQASKYNQTVFTFQLAGIWTAIVSVLYGLTLHDMMSLPLMISMAIVTALLPLSSAYLAAIFPREPIASSQIYGTTRWDSGFLDLVLQDKRVAVRAIELEERLHRTGFRSEFRAKFGALTSIPRTLWKGGVTPEETLFQLIISAQGDARQQTLQKLIQVARSEDSTQKALALRVLNRCVTQSPGSLNFSVLGQLLSEPEKTLQLVDLQATLLAIKNPEQHGQLRALLPAIIARLLDKDLSVRKSANRVLTAMVRNNIVSPNECYSALIPTRENIGSSYAPLQAAAKETLISLSPLARLSGKNLLDEAVHDSFSGNTSLLTALGQRILIYMGQNDGDYSAEQLKERIKALTENPDELGKLLFAVAASMSSNRAFESAMQIVEDMDDRTFTPENFKPMMIGIILADSMTEENSDAHFAQAKALPRAAPICMAMMAMRLARQGKFILAKQAIEELAASPDRMFDWWWFPQAMQQVASEQARAGMFADAERTAHRFGGPWETAVALAHIAFHEARWNKQTEALKHFQQATHLLYERDRNWDPKSESNRVAVLAESAGLEARDGITYGDVFEAMRARMVRSFTQGRLEDALFIARSKSPEKQVALLCYLAALYAGAGMNFMPILEEARTMAMARYGAEDLTLVAETYSELGVNPSLAAESALERLIQFNPGSDDKNLQRIANVYLSLGMFTNALNVLAGINDISRTPEAISTLVTHRILETFGRSPISREMLESTLKQAIEGWRARSILHDAILNPRKADEYFHSLIAYQNQGLLQPPQIAQYQTVLALKLAEFGILPSSYGSIQIKWLGTLMEGHHGIRVSRVLRIEKENADAYPGIPGTFKGHFVYADTALAFPLQFGSYWFFDESHWQPFTVKGRQFVGIGAEVNGNAALYMDIQTGAAFTLCVWADRSDSDYANHMIESFQSAYNEAGAQGVRRTLAAVGDQANIAKLLAITREWIARLPEQDRKIITAPITSDDISAERDASRLLEFIQERIDSMKSVDRISYERYFGQMKYGTPVWVPDIHEHVTAEGMLWLANFLNCSVTKVPRKLQQIRLVHQYYNTINPDRVFRILYLFSMGQGLSHELPKLSHRHALRDQIVPDLQRLNDLSQTVANAPALSIQLEQGSHIQTIELALDQIMEPLGHFLQAHFPEALEHGIFIYNQFVPPNMIANYTVLPGDRYHAVSDWNRNSSRDPKSNSPRVPPLDNQSSGRRNDPTLMAA